MFFDEMRLVNKCLVMICAHASLVFKTEHFRNLPHTCVKLIIERDDIDLAEVKVFEGVVNWAVAQLRRKSQVLTDTQLRNEVRHALGPLLYLIRFPLMSRQEFSDVTHSLDILSNEEKCLVKKYIESTRKPDLQRLMFSTQARAPLPWVLSQDSDHRVHGYQTSSLRIGLRLAVPPKTRLTQLFLAADRSAQTPEMEYKVRVCPAVNFINCCTDVTLFVKRESIKTLPADATSRDVQYLPLSLSLPDHIYSGFDESKDLHVYVDIEYSCRRRRDAHTNTVLNVVSTLQPGFALTRVGDVIDATFLEKSVDNCKLFGWLEKVVTYKICEPSTKPIDNDVITPILLVGVKSANI